MMPSTLRRTVICAENGHMLSSAGSVVAAQGLTGPAACGICPDQGSNPRSLFAGGFLTTGLPREVPAISKDTLLHRNRSLPSYLVMDKLRNMKGITRTSRLGASWETPTEQSEEERPGRQTSVRRTGKGLGTLAPASHPTSQARDPRHPAGRVQAMLKQTLELYTENMKVTQSCPTLCNPPDYTVHGILQAGILEWVRLSLLQGIFPTQESNQGLLQCKWIL